MISNMISCGCFSLKHQFHSSYLKIMIELTIKDLTFFFQKSCLLCIGFSFWSIPTRCITRTHPPPNLYRCNNTVIQSKIVQLLSDNSGHAFRRLAKVTLCVALFIDEVTLHADASLPWNWGSCNACGNDTLANSSLRFSSHLPSCP